MPMISYRCPDCGWEGEHFHHHQDQAPASIECRGFRMVDPQYEEIQREVVQPDGKVVIEIEKLELAPTFEFCIKTALQRDSYPGELWATPARGFEPLVVYERTGELPRGIDRYYIPGRNNEPTEPGMKRIELTSMAQYNTFVKHANEEITQRMRDHRSMHEEYWKARRKAMRDNVNARIRHNPLLLSLARLVRARSDRKSIARYGKPLDAHFHAQLLEFNQGNMQDFCAEDTGWRSRRAK